MRFALMWAYHDRDVPFQSKFGEEKKHHLWKLARTEADFLAAAHRIDEVLRAMQAKTM